VDVQISVPKGAERLAVFGSADRNLKMIREALGVRLAGRDGHVRISGEEPQVLAARRVLERLVQAARGDDPEGRAFASRQDLLGLISETMHQVSEGGGAWGDEGDGSSRAPWGDTLNVYVAGKPVRGRTPNQQRYLEAIRDHDVVFGIGPAGTGKTYLAVAAAVHMLKAGHVRKVILARPAVEAGEKLGFLPGDLQAKVNPYLRPLFDALHDMMDFATLKRFMMSDVVEVVPLAYMRGRTLNRSVIILDEAQNTTRGQMKMFLTRMGQGSRMVITGDTTQIDLPDPTQSGLIDAARILRRTRGIAMVTLEEADIVRHDMVQRIVESYAQHEARQEARHEARQDARGQTRRGSANPTRPTRPARASREADLAADRSADGDTDAPSTTEPKA
jgi:phosphate starvation-inducible PhoH-like protein